MISCLMPNWNTDQYLAEAIESVLNQSYKDFELIIQDDGSTDSSRTIIDYFVKKDKRVKGFYNPKNMGIAKTRNNAFGHSKGEYIAVCDSDDINHPDRLKLSLKAIQKADIVFSPCLNADANGKVFQITEVPKQLDLEILRKGDQQIPQPVIMAKRECFKDHPYREEFKCNDDLMLIYDWYLAGYKWKRVNIPFIIHRHYSASTEVARKDESNKYGILAKSIFEEGLRNAK